MATALDVITDALRELGVLAAGEVATADEATNGLTVLNRLVDGWAANSLQIYTVTRTTWSLVPSTQNYTVGAGGTVNIARPMYIDRVNFQDTVPTNPLEYPLRRATNDEWEMLRIKTLTSTLPTHYYYNPTYPLGTLSFWPIPTQSSLQGVIYTPTAVTEFAALTTAISLPPGYRRMLVKNLALELGPSYGRQPDPMLLRQAQSAMQVVKRSNAKPIVQRFDAGALVQESGVRAGYNIRTDS